MAAINTPADGSYGYVAFYNGKQVDVWAHSAFAAVELARRYFKPPKSKTHMVHIELVAVNGKPVTHVPTM